MTCRHGHNDQYGDCGKCPCPATGKQHRWGDREAPGVRGTGCLDCSATPPFPTLTHRTDF